MTRWLRVLALVLVLLPASASAHVGSPDVFFEGTAGPYRLFVTVRTPPVIPGIATIEIRSDSPDVREVTVVPMRLTGPGSELPPTPDHATRSDADPQFFTAELWLMEHGSLQVRVAVTGARGAGTLAVPVPAYARETLTMSRGLGALLFGLMTVLALAIVGILGGAVREATREPGAPAPPPPPARLAMAIAGVAVVGLLALGNLWWTSEANNYAAWVMKPWTPMVRIDGCTLRIAQVADTLLPDHGHPMHAFLVSDERMLHFHPERGADGDYEDQLPYLPKGRYRLFVDIVLGSGFPVTGTTMVDVPDLRCGPVEGDDSIWSGEIYPDVTWDKPAEIHAGEPLRLRFHVAGDAPLEPYMGMAGHAMVLRDDGSVFAHLHPNGSVAMPALALAGGKMALPDGSRELVFPYGFPKPGSYRVFVQFKRGGVVGTQEFRVTVSTRT